MNAQDRKSGLPPEDAALLAGVDRVLANPQPLTDGDPDSFEMFCARLVEATPQADPAFRELLSGRLASAVEQRQGSRNVLARCQEIASRRLTDPLWPTSRHRSDEPSGRRAATRGGPYRPGISWSGVGGTWNGVRWRVASVLLVVLVAGGGIGTYLHTQSATPVDAQAVLHRAEAVSPGPNEAIHEMYRLTAGGGLSGTADVWIGADAMGAPTQLALTQRMRQDGQPAPNLGSRLVRTDQTIQVYDPATNTVTVASGGRPLDPLTTSSSSPTIQDLEGMFVGTLLAQKLSRLLQSGSQPNAVTVQRQTLDGVSVYAIRLLQPAAAVSPAISSQTLYFNTQTYVLQGADWTQGGRAWQARLDFAGYSTMALSAVPANTFLLNAPASAHVVTLAAPAEGPKSGNDPILSTMATACHTTVQAISGALQAGGQSMLDICRQTSPGMTADQLVSDLMVPLKAQLDAQVRAGTITAAQEADDLTNLQTKLTMMVTGKGGTGPGKSGSAPGGKQP